MQTPPANAVASRPCSSGSWIGVPLLVTLVVGLYLLSRANFLLFHALVELFSVVVACGIFMLAWHARRFHRSAFLLCLGIASLCVAGLDLLHTLAYKNMGVFAGGGANLPTQLWVAARALQAAALLIAPLFLGCRPRPLPLFAGWLAAATALLVAVFSGYFPACFVEGRGLTPFKIVSEYLIVAALTVALLLLWRRRAALAPGVLRLLLLALVASIGAELFFSLYSDVFGICNVAGHLCKAAGFYFIYRGVIATGLTQPYELLFRELKQSEEALRQRSTALEESNCELEAINDQLTLANRELEEVNAELETFNYSVTHDLRGPLTAISGQCEVILHIFSSRVDAEVRQFIEGIHSETWRMHGLINTLLNFSRLGRVELHRRPVDLGALAQGIVQGLMLRDTQRAVSFDIASGAATTTEADPDLVRVLLDNLLGNAWKYTGKTAAPQIAFGAVADAGEQVFFVRDNGAGFDPAQADQLFMPFRRLHGREEFDGHGIGLATAQRIVSRHGGRIWAQGEPGRGASFYFTLQGRPDRATASSRPPADQLGH